MVKELDSPKVVVSGESLSRNEKIAAVLKQGRVPVLPFETDILKNLRQQSVQAANTLREAEQLPYPRDGLEVTLGSVAEIEYGPNDREVVFIAGAITDIDEIQRNLGYKFPDDSSGVRLITPLGECLMGATPGQTVTYTVHDKEIAIKVIGVAQLRPLDVTDDAA